MLTTTGAPSPCNLISIFKNHTDTTCYVAFPYQMNKIACFQNTSSVSLLFSGFPRNSAFFSSFRKYYHAHLDFWAADARRSYGFTVSALKKKAKVGVQPIEMDEFVAEDEFDDEDEDDDDSIVLPLDKMKNWLGKKPRGFGEGKVYDTSIEDKLLEELEESKQTQIADVTKLKSNPVEPISNQNGQQKKANEVVHHGIRVRVVNLPKKKNIHRDLKLAFKGFPGIVSIKPLVSGNKKTREPVCKGIAFVEFKSEAEATRFIQMYSQQRITFGKIEKQIKCEMIDLPKSDSLVEGSEDNACCGSKQMIIGTEQGENDDVDVDNSSLDMWEVNASYEYDNLDNNLSPSELEDIRENLETVTISEQSDDNGFKRRIESESSTHSPSSEKYQELDKKQLSPSSEKYQELEKKQLSQRKEESVREKNTVAEGNGDKSSKKKLRVKDKQVKVPELDIPGSAKRLRVKEKAVLADVFSKYGIKTASGLKEKSHSK